jgi:dinuclear metal center YbgI/SA1388 family protein
MTTVSDVVDWLELFAPSRLAEPWDNTGLLWGDPDAVVTAVMTCLTVTPVTAAEAIHEQASLIVSHHPVLFREVKRVRADVPETAPLWKLARSGVAIASRHTAFDNAPGGINDLLCHRLGLVDISALRPIPRSRDGSADSARLFKIVVFTPESDREAVLSAAFGAGAGRIGAYEECSFAIPGEGTFFGTEATNPAVGKRGRRETVGELRLEIVCPGEKLASAVGAIRRAHSYEEPAIDVYLLHDPARGDIDSIQTRRASMGSHDPARADMTVGGVGRIGHLQESRPLDDFARLVNSALATRVDRVGDPRREVLRVAVACGAGDDFLKDAARAGADVLVTGEARFHRALEAEALGIGLVLAGHHATERLGVEELARLIAQAFPYVKTWPSEREADPLHSIGGETP